MAVEIMVWTATREMFVKGMSETLLPDKRPLATYDSKSGKLIAVQGVSIDEIGPITKAPAVTDPQTFAVITPAVIVPGHHVNMKAEGDIEKMLLSNGLGGTLPQYDKDGKLLDLFQRTNLRMLIAGLQFKQVTVDGVPSGWEGPNGVRLFDPALITNRRRVWL